MNLILPLAGVILLLLAVINMSFKAYQSYVQWKRDKKVVCTGCRDNLPTIQHPKFGPMHESNRAYKGVLYLGCKDPEKYK